jgi:hypothetical protein
VGLKRPLAGLSSVEFSGMGRPGWFALILLLWSMVHCTGGIPIREAIKGLSYDEAKRWRKANAEKLCNENTRDQISDTGAWCLSNQSVPVPMRDAPPGYWLPEHHADGDAGIASFMVTLIKANQTVLDLGCGVGQYGHLLNKIAPGISYHGYDGAVNGESFTNDFINWIDLSVPIELPVTSYSWVISIEVGEHLPLEFEQTYLDNIAKYAQCGIFTSWAMPRQKGHGHVNCRPMIYIAEQLEARGFKFIEPWTKESRNRVSVSTSA